MQPPLAAALRTTVRETKGSGRLNECAGGHLAGGERGQEKREEAKGWQRGKKGRDELQSLSLERNNNHPLCNTWLLAEKPPLA